LRGHGPARRARARHADPNDRGRRPRREPGRRAAARDVRGRRAPRDRWRPGPGRPCGRGPAPRRRDRRDPRKPPRRWAADRGRARPDRAPHRRRGRDRGRARGGADGHRPGRRDGEGRDPPPPRPGGLSMLDRLFDFVLRHRGLAILFALAVAAIGIFSVRHVPFDAYPDLTGNIVEVITTAPGYATEEVERLVTYPLESSLMGLPGAENVRSISKSGLSIITVTFPDRFDIHFARTLVQQ